MSRNDPIQRRVTSSSIKAAVASAAVVATLGGWAAIGLTDARQSAAAPAAQQAAQQQLPAQQQQLPAQGDQGLPQLGFEPRQPRFGEDDEYEQGEWQEHEGYEEDEGDDDGLSQAAPQTAPQQAQPNGQTQTAPQQRAITRTRSSR